MAQIETLTAQVRDGASWPQPRRIARIASSLVVTVAWCWMISAAAGMVMHLVG